MEIEEFRHCAKQLVDYIVEYHKTISERPVLPNVQPGYIKDLIPDEAPTEGESWSNIYNDIERVIMPGMTHWSSPHFHAYYPSVNSFPSVCAELLSAAVNCIGFSWASAPACTELEMRMTDWLGKMLNLPEEFLFCSGGKGGGIIQASVSESTLLALLASRKLAIAFVKEDHPGMEDAEIHGRLVAYTSDQGHSSIRRASLFADVLLRSLPTDGDYSLKGATLKEAIDADRRKGLIPIFVAATMGTTSSCAFDDVEAIGQICKEEGLWLHVDAAYAGSVLMCPEFSHLTKGLQNVDTFVVSPHKWMMVNHDCSVMWMRNHADFKKLFAVDPAYLRHDNEEKVPDYRHWQIPLGRRFRSLKLWFVIRSFGTKGLQEIMRKHIGMAHEFEKLVLQDSRFEICAPVMLGLVCFRLKGPNAFNERLLKRINGRRRIHLTPAELQGTYVIRFVVCSRDITMSDIQYAWKEVVHATNSLLGEQEDIKVRSKGGDFVPKVASSQAWIKSPTH